MIQASWKGYHWRQKFLRVKRSGLGLRKLSEGGAEAEGASPQCGVGLSHLCPPQLSASSPGGGARWAGGRQPRGSGQPRPSESEQGYPKGNAKHRVGCVAIHPSILGSPIPRLIRGFMLRHAPRCPENAFFLDYVRTSFLLNLRRQLPRNVLDTSWPTPPPALHEVCDHLVATQSVSGWPGLYFNGLGTCLI